MSKKKDTPVRLDQLTEEEKMKPYLNEALDPHQNSEKQV